MSFMSLKKRLQKLERTIRPRDDNSFTLMELCRAMWTWDKEHFKEQVLGSSLSVAVRYLEAEDATREWEQSLREQELRRASRASEKPSTLVAINQREGHPPNIFQGEVPTSQTHPNCRAGKVSSPASKNWGEEHEQT